MSRSVYPRKVILPAFLALLLLGSSIEAAEVPERLALPGAGYLNSSWIPEDGPALIVWESSEHRWSKVEVYEDATKAREWTFTDALVKSARWTEPGRSFVLGVVVPAGTGSHGIAEDRVYSIAAAGGLALMGSTRALEADGRQVSLSPSGEEWSRFQATPGGADLEVGRLGGTTPGWTWDLRTSELGPVHDPKSVDELTSRAEILGGREHLVAVLWGGRLWLAEIGSSRRTELVPPRGCSHLQTFVTTAGGLWADCIAWHGERPFSVWAFYRTSLVPGARSSADLTATFRHPWFLPDGTIVDLVGRRTTGERREARIYDLVPGHDTPRLLGTVDLPSGEARYVPAGEVLLESLESAEEYRVIPIAREAARLRRSTGP